jgi:hypothetical protein
MLLDVKMKWSERVLRIGELFVGGVMPHEDETLKETPWSAWFSSSIQQELLGLFKTENDAKNAVEERAVEGLQKNETRLHREIYQAPR